MKPGKFLQADKLSGKEVKTNPPNLHTSPPPKTGSKNFYLCVLQHLRSGMYPAQIAKHLGISKQALQYHLTKLKASGAITKIGYGTWEVSDTAILEDKKSKKLPRVGKATPPTFEQTNLYLFEVRGHAFVFTLKLQPGLRNWTNENRITYLKRNNIAYKPLNLGGDGQRIEHKGHKIWLTNKSIILYDKNSYFAKEAGVAKSRAIYNFIQKIKSLEHLLKADFTIKAGTQYKFKVSRQHYALVKNALARQYNEANEKLEVYTEKGLWFLIDNSFNLDEVETVHPETAETDNKKIQDFFNSVKEQPKGITIGELLELSAGIQNNQILFSENALAHVDVIKQLGLRVQDLNDPLKDLNELLKDLKEELRK
jgi:DNA-binding transcriptional ArsR family regulator